MFIIIVFIILIIIIIFIIFTVLIICGLSVHSEPQCATIHSPASRFSLLAPRYATPNEISSALNDGIEADIGIDSIDINRRPSILKCRAAWRPAPLRANT